MSVAAEVWLKASVSLGPFLNPPTDQQAADILARHPWSGYVGPEIPFHWEHVDRPEAGGAILALFTPPQRSPPPDGLRYLPTNPPERRQLMTLNVTCPTTIHRPTEQATITVEIECLTRVHGHLPPTSRTAGLLPTSPEMRLSRYRKRWRISRGGGHPGLWLVYWGRDERGGTNVASDIAPPILSNWDREPARAYPLTGGVPADPVYIFPSRTRPAGGTPLPIGSVAKNGPVGGVGNDGRPLSQADISRLHGPASMYTQQQQQRPLMNGVPSMTSQQQHAASLQHQDQYGQSAPYGLTGSPVGAGGAGLPGNGPIDPRALMIGGAKGNSLAGGVTPISTAPGFNKSQAENSNLTNDAGHPGNANSLQAAQTQGQSHVQQPQAHFLAQPQVKARAAATANNATGAPSKSSATGASGAQARSHKAGGGGATNGAAGSTNVSAPNKRGGVSTNAATVVTAVEPEAPVIPSVDYLDQLSSKHLAMARFARNHELLDNVFDPSTVDLIIREKARHLPFTPLKELSDVIVETAKVTDAAKASEPSKDAAEEEPKESAKEKERDTEIEDDKDEANDKKEESEREKESEKKDKSEEEDQKEKENEKAKGAADEKKEGERLMEKKKSDSIEEEADIEDGPASELLAESREVPIEEPATERQNLEPEPVEAETLQLMSVDKVAEERTPVVSGSELAKEQENHHGVVNKSGEAPGQEFDLTNIEQVVLQCAITAVPVIPVTNEPEFRDSAPVSYADHGNNVNAYSKRPNQSAHETLEIRRHKLQKILESVQQQTSEMEEQHRGRIHMFKSG